VKSKVRASRSAIATIVTASFSGKSAQHDENEFIAKGSRQTLCSGEALSFFAISIGPEFPIVLGEELPPFYLLRNPCSAREDTDSGPTACIIFVPFFCQGCLPATQEEIVFNRNI
jgi:hypothetical protein